MTPTEITEAHDKLIDAVEGAYDRAEELRAALVSTDCVVHSDLYVDSGTRAAVSDLSRLHGFLLFCKERHLQQHLERLPK